MLGSINTGYTFEMRRVIVESMVEYTMPSEYMRKFNTV